MHLRTGYPLYNLEAHYRMSYYPGPYYTPWCYIDGDVNGGGYTTWQSKIVARMNQPAPVTATIWGTYAPTDGSGTVYVKFRNDSTASITGRIIVVVTEDSIYSPAPNGDTWHNHVARDYLPTQNGEIVTIPAGDSVTINRIFTIPSTWNEDRCRITAWIQNDTQIGSRKEVWQGVMKEVTEFVGVKEHTKDVVVSSSVIAAPNPCVNGTVFSFVLPVDQNYRIDIYESTGRLVRTMQGAASGCEDHVQWDLKDAFDQKVSSGVYLYRFSSGVDCHTGTVVIR